MFFSDLFEFVRHCNKRHIFLGLFVLFCSSITCRNEAIIVELKAFFVLNGTLSTFLGFPSLDFSQLQKMVPALAFNFIIVATNA